SSRTASSTPRFRSTAATGSWRSSRSRGSTATRRSSRSARALTRCNAWSSRSIWGSSHGACHAHGRRQRDGGRNAVRRSSFERDRVHAPEPGRIRRQYGSAVTSAVLGEAATTAVLVEETQLEEARRFLPTGQ